MSQGPAHTEEHGALRHLQSEQHVIRRIQKYKKPKYIAKAIQLCFGTRAELGSALEQVTEMGQSCVERRLGGAGCWHGRNRASSPIFIFDELRSGLGKIAKVGQFCFERRWRLRLNRLLNPNFIFDSIRDIDCQIQSL
jgi:hypothetical protein